MTWNPFRTLEEKDKNDAVKRIMEESTPNGEFFLMIVLSIVMATFGLLMNNASVIIGSMLIAPLLSPILGLALSVVMADQSLMYRAGKTILKSLVFAIGSAFILSLLFLSEATLEQGVNAEIISRMEPSLLFGAVAIVSGVAAAFAFARPRMNASLPGVAISVALIPPLAVVGIGLAQFNWTMASRSFILFLINAISIVFAALVVFSLMNLYRKQPLAQQVAKKEDRELEEQKNGN